MAFSSFAANNNAAAPAPTVASTNNAPPVSPLPDWKTFFPHWSWAQVVHTHWTDLQQEQDQWLLAAQELHYFLQTTVVPYKLALPAASSTATTSNAHSHNIPLGIRPTLTRLAGYLQCSIQESAALYAAVANDQIPALPQEWPPIVVSVQDDDEDEIVGKVLQMYYTHAAIPLHIAWMILQGRLVSSSSSNKDVWKHQMADLFLQHGMVDQWISYIQGCNDRLYQLQQIAAGTTNTNNNVESSNPPIAYHVQGTRHLRQLACECLLYAAYASQWTLSEIVQVYDLSTTAAAAALVSSSSMTNGQGQAPPLSMQSSNNNINNPWMSGTTSSATSLPFSLQSLWWKPRKTTTSIAVEHDLQQIVTILLCTVATALNGQQRLWDRTTHAWNVFGVGNAVLPPGTSEEQAQVSLQPILAKLSHHKNADSNNTLLQGLQGFLSCSVATLMYHSAGQKMTKTAKQYWKQGCECQVMRYIQEILLPSIQSLSSSSSSYQKGGAVLVDFLYSILTEWMPPPQIFVSTLTSKAKWLKDQQDELQAQHINYAQVLQFQQDYFPRGQDKSIPPKPPTAVDLSKRPDCLDDALQVLATLIAVSPCLVMEASQEQDLLLDVLQPLVQQDASLMDVYLQLLVSCADRPFVSALLEGGTDNKPSSSSSMSPTWTNIVGTLWSYAQAFHATTSGNSTYTATSVSTTASGGTPDAATTSQDNTNYYYLDSENRNGAANGIGGDANNGFGKKTSSTSSGHFATTGLKELNLADESYVLAHLQLIQAVSKASTSSRKALLQLELQMEGGATSDALFILFSLSMGPLSPTIRGATLEAIAALLNPEGMPPEEGLVAEKAKKAWELLEESQMLPIRLLDQYPMAAMNSGDPNLPMVAFPPSSKALAATSAGDGLRSVFPTDPKYGLIYEMEHVERSLGYYASTKGFITLLRALVLAGGCPESLGMGVRYRTGATPYIEYVTDVLIPYLAEDELPVATHSEYWSLCGAIVALVDTVLRDYSLPSGVLRTSGQAVPAVETWIGLSNPPSKPSSKNEEVDKLDFRASSAWEMQKAIRASDNGSFLPQQDTKQRELLSRIPALKSPGFWIMTKALSDGEALLPMLIHLIHSSFSTNWLEKVVRAEEGAFSLGVQLLQASSASPPTYSTPGSAPVAVCRRFAWSAMVRLAHLEQDFVAAATVSPVAACLQMSPFLSLDVHRVDIKHYQASISRLQDLLTSSEVHTPWTTTIPVLQGKLPSSTLELAASPGLSPPRSDGGVLDYSWILHPRAVQQGCGPTLILSKPTLVQFRRQEVPATCWQVHLPLAPLALAMHHRLGCHLMILSSSSAAAAALAKVDGTAAVEQWARQAAEELGVAIPTDANAWLIL